MMARTKRIYTLMFRVKKLIFFSASRYFLKEIENMFSVFLSTELKKHSWKFGRSRFGRPAARVRTAFLVLPNYHSCFYNSIETGHSVVKMFCVQTKAQSEHFQVHQMRGAFWKSTVLWRFSVDGRPSRWTKAAFSNFNGVETTGPETDFVFNNKITYINLFCPKRDC